MDKSIKQGFWDKLFQGDLEHSRFGIISVTLIVVACIGGCAQVSGVGGSVAQMALTVFPTMGVLVLILAVQPLKWILNVSILAIAIDACIILYNLFMV